MSDDDFTSPGDNWQERLILEELVDRDQLVLEQELGLRLYGYREPEASIIGYRVLHEDDGYADLLLMRRNFAQSGYLFDLDVKLGKLTNNESEELHRQVLQTIDMLMRERVAVQS